MRQVLVQVPRGNGGEVLDIANEHEAINVACYKANRQDQALDVIVMHVSNRNLEGVLEQLQSLPALHMTIFPQPVLVLKPPPSEAPQQVTNIQPRSPIEVILNGLQSIGSWKGFLGYAAAAGIVVWIGLFTNTVYLLIAAMLIAPFAGPAMNVAIGAATGHSYMLKRGLLRYFVSLAVTMMVTALLTLILGQNSLTNLMVDVSHVSAVAVLLPLITGAAGALNLIQSEGNSLVAGTAVGLLVAASLAPPAGVIGMASAMGLWNMAWRGVFVLLLQLAGINLAGAIVFRLYGLSAGGVRYEQGQGWLFKAAIGLTVLTLGGLLYWQFSDALNLQRSSEAQRIAQTIEDVVEDNEQVTLVEIGTHFTRLTNESESTLVGTVYAWRKSGVDVPTVSLELQLKEAIVQRLMKRNPEITPLVQVYVVERPEDG
jgi:uncharacterized membrane protein